MEDKCFFQNTQGISSCLLDQCIKNYPVVLQLTQYPIILQLTQQAMLRVCHFHTAAQPTFLPWPSALNQTSHLTSTPVLRLGPVLHLRKGE